MPLLGRLRTLARLARDSNREALGVAGRVLDAGRLSGPEQYAARFGVLQGLAHAWGFETYNEHLAWLEDEPRFWSLREAFPVGGQRADRKFVVWSFARAVAGLPGDTAECGVLHGHSSHLICAATGAPGRLHHVFDSFEGLSEPGREDTPASAAAWEWRQGDLAVPLEQVRKNLGAYCERIRFYEGWIPSRFAEVADREFCFVHVDVDLYEPTRDSLAFFYERLVPGGILLCDDYGYTTCPGARRAFDELVAGRPEQSVLHLPTGQGFIVKRPGDRPRRDDAGPHR